MKINPSVGDQPYLKEEQSYPSRHDQPVNMNQKGENRSVKDRL